MSESFRPVADLRDGPMREPFNPHCGKQGSYPTGTTPTFRVAGRLNPPPANPIAKIRFWPNAEIGMSLIAAALSTLTHVTIDSFAVQLSFHFVRHSQALGNAAR